MYGLNGKTIYNVTWKYRGERKSEWVRCKQKREIVKLIKILRASDEPSLCKPKLQGRWNR